MSEKVKSRIDLGDGLSSRRDGVLSSSKDLILRNFGEEALSFLIGDSKVDLGSEGDDDDRPLVLSLEASSILDDSSPHSLARASAAGNIMSMFSSNPSSRLVLAVRVGHVLV